MKNPPLITHMLPYGPHEIINSVVVSYDSPETPAQRELRILQGLPAPTFGFTVSNVRQTVKNAGGRKS